MGSLLNLLQKVASSDNSMLSAHALLLLRKYNTNDHIKAMEELATNLMARNDTVINLYLAISLGPWTAISMIHFCQYLAQLSQTYPGNAVFQEAIVSSLKG